MREKLIEWLFELQNECYSTPCDECEHFGKFQCLSQWQADRLIANGVTLQKWIPVSERLPMPYEVVLTCRRAHSSSAKIICNEYLTLCCGETTVWCLDLGTWKSEVTHWMPLPEAPKGE